MKEGLYSLIFFTSVYRLVYFFTDKVHGYEGESLISTYSQKRLSALFLIHELTHAHQRLAKDAVMDRRARVSPSHREHRQFCVSLKSQTLNNK